MTSLMGLYGPTTTLADSLRHRLPSLATALAEDNVAAEVGRLLTSETSVAGVSAGQAWLRRDGTCTLRYDVRLVPPAGAPRDRATLLCRVHTDEDAAAEYVATRVLPLAGPSPPPAESVWRAWAGVVAGTGIALHAFPLDPELPTLRQAIDPLLPQRLLPDLLPRGEEVRAQVVHHPRQGACVLRYGVPYGDDTATEPGRRGLYGKVYADQYGAVVEQRLRALKSDEPPLTPRGLAHFPVPLTYHRALRLLLTEEMPGSAVVPRLLARVLGAEADPAMAAALVDAVRQCGCALAVLHAHGRVPAPARAADLEMTELVRELRMVAAVWPERAERVGRCVPEPPPGRRDLVLCHGDYTPAQVLLSAGACGVTDLDGLCWADPALDVGRFLGSLDLLAAKNRRAGHASLMHELTAAFLDGYGRTGPTQGLDTSDPTAGVDAYRRVGLARSALHACRQLKDDRFTRAVSLLECDPGGLE